MSGTVGNKEKNNISDTIEWAKQLQNNLPENSKNNSLLVVLCIGAFSFLIFILLIWISLTKNDKEKSIRREKSVHREALPYRDDDEYEYFTDYVTDDGYTDVYTDVYTDAPQDEY